MDTRNVEEEPGREGEGQACPGPLLRGERQCWLFGWTRDEWERYEDGYEVVTCVSQRFTSRGVRPGDLLYIVARIDRMLHLGARLQVDKVLSGQSPRQALEAACNRPSLGLDLDFFEDGFEACTVDEDWSSFFHCHLQVPDCVVENLEFHTASGITRLRYEQTLRGLELDGQTLRGLRRLTRESAQLLDDVLISAPPC